jgi:2-keto-4-pentenoate hydratase
LAQLISNCRQQKVQLTEFPTAISPRSLSEAIQVTNVIFGDSKPVAWKLGGTNQNTRAAFQTNDAYWGGLHPSEILEPNCSLNFNDLIAPLAEPEIVLVFARDICPTPLRRRSSDLFGLLAWVSVAIEIPDSVLAVPKVAGLLSLIADRCGAGRLLVGPQLEPAKLFELEASTVEFTASNGQINRGHGNWILGGVMSSITTAIHEMGRFGISIPAGTLISVGGLTKPLKLQSNMHYEANFGKYTLGLHTNP